MDTLRDSVFPTSKMACYLPYFPFANLLRLLLSAAYRISMAGGHCFLSPSLEQQRHSLSRLLRQMRHFFSLRVRLMGLLPAISLLHLSFFPILTNLKSRS